MFGLIILYNFDKCKNTSNLKTYVYIKISVKLRKTSGLYIKNILIKRTMTQNLMSVIKTPNLL